VLPWLPSNSIPYLSYLFNQFLVYLCWIVGLLSLKVIDEDILWKLYDVMFLETDYVWKRRIKYVEHVFV